MADLVKALAIVVKIELAWVRVPAVAAMKMDAGMTPPPPNHPHPTESGPMIQAGPKWKTSEFKLN